MNFLRRLLFDHKREEGSEEYKRKLNQIERITAEQERRLQYLRRERYLYEQRRGETPQ